MMHHVHAASLHAQCIHVIKRSGCFQVGIFISG
jgi:hypothetical protein